MLTFGQVATDSHLKAILSVNKDTLFQRLLSDPEHYRIQIIYTEINRDKDNNPSFKTYRYHVDKDLYFNPASTVKLPVAILSLQKLNELKVPGVDKSTSLLIDSARSPQTKQGTDPSSENAYPSIAHFIKEALLISENNPYTRMYEFLGQKYLNSELWKRGYSDVRIIRRFAPNFTEEGNRYTNPMRFIDSNGSVLYAQPETYSDLIFDFPKEPVLLGKAHWDNNDSVIYTPMDFTKQNNLPLQSLHDMLKAVLFPASTPENRRFNLKDSDYHFLYQYLSQFPGETNYPKYDREKYSDSYVKFFFSDSAQHPLPEGVRVFNKVGWSYGFMTDVSYVVDFKNKIEYMLAATVYVNEDDVINDGIYEYDTAGRPFLYQLGQTVYQYELKRKRTIIPDLSDFVILYEKRVPDNRPVISSAAN